MRKTLAFFAPAAKVSGMACLCDQCAGLCCRYFALPIDNPETARQYDDIRWYLCHEKVVVFIEKKQWYLGILNRCKHLQPNNRCGIYHTRPRICRNYSLDNCDYHGGDYNFEVLFTSAEQLESYARDKLREARRRKRPKKAARPRRPSLAGGRRRLGALPDSHAAPKPNGHRLSLRVLPEK